MMNESSLSIYLRIERINPKFRTIPLRPGALYAPEIHLYFLSLSSLEMHLFLALPSRYPCGLGIELTGVMGNEEMADTCADS